MKTFLLLVLTCISLNAFSEEGREGDLQFQVTEENGVQKQEESLRPQKIIRKESRNKNQSKKNKSERKKEG
jgi:hypothetical protein